MIESPLYQVLEAELTRTAEIQKTRKLIARIPKIRETVASLPEWVAR